MIVKYLNINIQLMIVKKWNIALVHDWFLDKSIGGSEKVTLVIDELLSNKYSIPDLFSLTENISKKHNSKYHKLSQDNLS